jgi:tRNA (cytidine/uridine-2'-O-)-methyltransferase
MPDSHATKPLLHVVLYQPDIPPNTGNIGRTCVAIGAKLWMVKPLGFSLDAKQLRRAGLDYWPHLEYEVVDDWAALLKRLPAERMWFVEKDGAKLYTDARFEVGDVLVFGSETSGIPAEWMNSHRERTIRLPMRREVRSINLASSASAVAYEVLRQFVVTKQIDHFPDAWNPVTSAE